MTMSRIFPDTSLSGRRAPTGRESLLAASIRIQKRHPFSQRRSNTAIPSRIGVVSDWRRGRYSTSGPRELEQCRYRPSDRTGPGLWRALSIGKFRSERIGVRSLRGGLSRSRGPVKQLADQRRYGTLGVFRGFPDGCLATTCWTNQRPTDGNSFRNWWYSSGHYWSRAVGDSAGIWPLWQGGWPGHRRRSGGPNRT